MYIAGVDEVGRGPWAGAVVACAVILKEDIAEARDSKLLSPKKREQLSGVIKKYAVGFAIGRAEVDEIDTLNIHHATLLAMKRAVEALPITPDKVVVDGLFVPKLSMPAVAIVKGDQTVSAIACASIIAKVSRDAEMVLMDDHYPGYHFGQHKGYGTVLHRNTLAQLGPCLIHRKSFEPVRSFGYNR